jgi:formylglycine-generating enzyme required for sulfatase activity
MGKYEVTWGEYRQYMELLNDFDRFKKFDMREITEEKKIDVVSAPSKLYEPTFTFQAGSGPRQPAATITQYSAKQYTKWLSLMSGQFFRLPTESEWEYACRAGSNSAFSFGDDASMLGDYAWFKDNAEGKRHDVGQKKPNAFGLFDMHGNVAEWVLDGYNEEGYGEHDEAGVKAAEAIDWPKEVYPRTVRGGSWELEAHQLRSAARLPSEDEDWKDKDPNFPLSPWWYTSSPATGVGFRLIRPLVEPSDRAEKEVFWKADHQEIEDDVNQRIDAEGRGKRGYVDPKLPADAASVRDK